MKRISMYGKEYLCMVKKHMDLLQLSFIERQLN